MSDSISTDEKHRATLAMLQEALDYLRRLPTVPATHAMCNKLQQHLDDPTSRLVAGQADTWSQEAVTAAGLIYLRARLCSNVLDLRIPDAPRGVAQTQVDQHAVDVLRGGLKLPMLNRDFVPFAASAGAS